MELVCMLGLGGSTNFLLLSLLILRTMSSGHFSSGSSLIGFETSSRLFKSATCFSTSLFVSPPCSKAPFSMDANWKGILCLLLAQPSSHPSPLWVTLLDEGAGKRDALLLEKKSLCSGLSFLYSSPLMRRVLL